MCVVKALREDRTLVSAQEYISEGLGARFVESVPLNMEGTWLESHNKCPLICLLSPGADPTRLIEDLAKRKKIKVLGVSMGQGQEIIARKYMASATVEGQWVLLQNTHLGLSYLSEVEGFLIKAEDIHDDFRLWITAEPHPLFPIGLLQMGIKITNEAPVGMRAGLRNSYAWVNQDMLDAVQRQEWRQLLFIMCFLHSIVQERRKFGPIGWNVPYEFNQSDLSACTQFLQNHLTEMDAKKAAQPTWATVTYMVSAIQYGGRITDDFDQLLMDTYAEKYFNSTVLARNYQLYPGYCVPDTTEIQVFRSEIEKLPATESPEIFGLHPNADLTYRTLNVTEAVSTIMETMPKSGGAAGGLSREEVVDKLCEELLAKVPAPFDAEYVKERLRKLPGGATQPLTVHLRQEIDRLNIIILLAAKTLQNLRLAIAGTVALSGDLIQALDCLYDARIPPVWLRKSWEAATLGNWFMGLTGRFNQLDKWISTGRPKAYWLTGFFNPQVSSGSAGRPALRRLLSHVACATDRMRANSKVLPSLTLLFHPPAGLPDGDEAGGEPQARPGQVGPRRRRDDVRGDAPAQGVRDAPRGCVGGGVRLRLVPGRLRVEREGEQARRLGAEEAVQPAAGAARDGSAGEPEEAVGDVRGAVLHDQAANGAQLHHHARPADGRAGAEVDPARRRAPVQHRLNVTRWWWRGGSARGRRHNGFKNPTGEATASTHHGGVVPLLLTRRDSNT